jgi:hypothetical protein
MTQIILELVLKIQSIISASEDELDTNIGIYIVTYAHEVLSETFSGGMECSTAIFPPMVAKVPVSADTPYSTFNEGGRSVSSTNNCS